MNMPGIASLPPAIERESTLLVLVRHGQTTWNVESRFQGQLDVPLSPIGLEQASALADWIAKVPFPISALYSSDLVRASTTAAPIAEKLSLAPVYARELRELSGGLWEGLTTTEINEQFPGQLEEWRAHIQSFTLPKGESVPQVQRRMSQYLENLVETHRGEAVIIVSHGAALASYIAYVLGWDLQETWESRRARMSNTGVTVLARPLDGDTDILLLNSTEHLTSSPDLPSVMDRYSGVDKREKYSEFAV